MAEGKAKNQMDFTSKAGNKFVFQKVTPVVWLDILDQSEQSGRMKRTDFYPAVLENIIVKPQMTIDDFEDYSELEEVVTAAVRFQQGKQ